MGLLDFLIPSRQYELAVQASLDPSTLPFVSPWASSDLQRIVFEDIFGSDVPNNTRAAAMRIPALARGRNVMVSSIARNPLVAKRKADPLDPQPSWIWATRGGMSPQLRMVWTVDDLMFYGRSCWWRDNGADGWPLAADRVDIADWSINDDMRIEINGEAVDPRQVIVFFGMHEGVLGYGYEAIGDIRALYTAVRKRLRNPIPGIDLHQTGGRDLTDDEIDVLIARWAAARDGVNGAVGFTNKDIEAKTLSGGDDGQLMIESRNAAAVDVARMIGVSASVIDATSPKASLNYETTENRNAELVDRDLALYMDPIAWRLSQDDVTPHGTHIAFDTAAFTGPTLLPTGPALED
ncbi:phage portal protein [Nocardioides sp. R1-1]|uniref:phage portal protein n=1 Tax=Nocardioides sp. R1-1 TaxID=3383502 RepID=UPI0038D204B5